MNTPKILVAVDDSEPSMRAVGHVAEMARAFRCADVTLFHVAGLPPEHAEHPGSEDPREERRLEEQVAERAAEWKDKAIHDAMPTIFGPARAKLEGIPGITVRLKVGTTPDKRVAETIVGELETDHYDAVAVGRGRHSKMSELLASSVTQRLIHDVKGCAVWVVD